VDTPDLPNEMPYYRSDEVTLLFRDMTSLQETQTMIASDVQQLVDSLKAQANLEIMQEATYA
jgi:hypothetical protein